MTRPVEHGDVTAVEVDGKVLVHVDGYLHGPSSLVGSVYALLDTRVSIDGMTSTKMLATLDTPLGIAVALLASSPGRARLISAPSDVVVQIAAERAMSSCVDN